MRFSRLLSLAAAAALAGCAATTATATAAVTHTVRRGETLTSVAATDGLTIDQVAAANGISPGAQLTVGMQLVIPPRGEAPAAVAAPASPGPATAVLTSSSGGVLVVLGDTLSSIAGRYGTSVDALAAANDMHPGDLLLAGRRLRLPGVATPTSTPVAAPAAVTDPASGGAVATDTFVTPGQVAAIASDDDVAPSLAEAIADQESGFDNDEVSDTGAIGVMQIEPGTWRDLTGPDGLTLSDNSALDNVRGGVTLLRGLLADTGGDEAEAVAAYYQGLESVRSRGMYADTRHYVRDVLALQARFGG